MKKNLIILLVSTILTTLFASSCFVSSGGPRYKRYNYRTVRVYIINNRPFIARGVVKFYKHGRYYNRRFRLRPGSDIIIRADRNSRVRVRYNGRTKSRIIRRGGQRIYL